MTHDPWLACALSVAIPGLGQLHVGSVVAGILLLSLDFTNLFTMTLLFDRYVFTLPMLAVLGGAVGLILRIVAAWHAHACSPARPARIRNAQPFKALALGFLIPPIAGFAYIGRWAWILAYLVFGKLLTVLLQHYAPGHMAPLTILSWTLHASAIVQTYLLACEKWPETMRRILLRRSVWFTAGTVVIIQGGLQIFPTDPRLLAMVESMQSLTMQSASMEPEIQQFEKVVFSHPDHLERGDIVALDLPNGIHRIRRIIGLPGEVMTVNQGLISVDGRVLEEPYARGRLRTVAGTHIRPIRLNGDSYFVLPDSRLNAVESDELVPVTTDQIKGEIRSVIWPLWSMRRVSRANLNETH